MTFLGGFTFELQTDVKGPDTRYNLGYDPLDTIHWIRFFTNHVTTSAQLI